MTLLLLLPLPSLLRLHLAPNQSLLENLLLVLMSLLALDLVVNLLLDQVRQRLSLKSQQRQRQLEVNLPQLVERL